MSYDLRIVGDAGALDLAQARAVLGDDGDEVLWLRDSLAATVVLTPAEIGVGVVPDAAPPEERARDFEELLRTLLALAERLNARLYDPQLGRELGADDVEVAVRGFA
jgi:hypothetical protein